MPVKLPAQESVGPISESYRTGCIVPPMPVCALGRRELSTLTHEEIQLREGRWASSAWIAVRIRSKNGDCLGSSSFRDLTAQSLQLKPGLLHSDPGRSSSLSSSWV